MRAYAPHKRCLLFRSRYHAQLAGMRFVLLFLGRLIREAVLYVGASPQSYLHQLETLNGVGDHLLRDVGLDRSLTAKGGPDFGTSSIGI
jgi:hypothetical protein